MGKKIETDTTSIHVRLSQQDVLILDGCAKMKGVSRSQYVRDIVIAHMSEELANHSVSAIEKIVRTTLENILDVKLEKQAQTLRTLAGEIERANMMQLKRYIEAHPGLDPSEYINYYYQSKKEAYELSSGRITLSSVLPSGKNSVSEKSVPNWMKIISGDSDDE